MALFKCESVLDKPSGKYAYVIYNSDKSDEILFESDPMFDTHDAAEAAAVEFVTDTLKQLDQ